MDNVFIDLFNIEPILIFSCMSQLQIIMNLNVTKMKIKVQ